MRGQLANLVPQWPPHHRSDRIRSSSRTEYLRPTGAAGAPVMLTTDQSFNAGPHYVLVEATFNPQAYGAGSMPASYVLKPYTLVVTQ